MASKKGKKSEKQNKTPEVIQVEERPTEKELVPGKGFYENDWALMVEREDNLLYICNLVEEVFEKSYAVLLHRQTEQETFSYSVQWAKELMVDKIECYFIDHDDGNTSPIMHDHKDNDCCLVEDIEPQTPLIDSWARGVVPMAASEHKEPSLIVINEDQSLENPNLEDKPVIDKTESIPVVPSKSSSLLSNLKSSSRSHHRNSKPSKPPMRVISPPLTGQQDGDIDNDSNRKYEESFSGSSHTPYSSTALITMPPLISGSDSKHGVPQNRSDVITDQYSRIIQTMPLNFKKFPSPSTKPIITVPSKESVVVGRSLITTNGFRKSAIGKATHSKRSLNHRKLDKSSFIIHKQQKKVDESAVLGGVNRVDSNRMPREPILPPFLDIIDPLPGVTVHENGQSLTGHVSPRNKLWSPSSRLHPINPVSTKHEKTTDSGSQLKHKDSLKLFLPSSLDSTPKVHLTT